MGGYIGKIQNTKESRAMAKLSKTQQKIYEMLEHERNNKGLREKYGYDTPYIKKIKEGKIKPTPSDVGKINAYQIKKFTPEMLAYHSGFSAEQIKNKMIPKFFSLHKMDELVRNKSFATGKRANGDKFYYYVIFVVWKNTGKVDVGHGFMFERNALYFMEEAKLQRYHTVVEDKSGEIYKEEYVIFDVLKYKNLAQKFKTK